MRDDAPIGIFFLVLQILLFVWYVYFTIKLAAHIGAWPF